MRRKTNQIFGVAVLIILALVVGVNASITPIDHWDFQGFFNLTNANYMGSNFYCNGTGGNCHDVLDFLASGSGDITSVTAGTGLTGGGVVGALTLNVSSETCGASEASKYNGTGFTCEVVATGLTNGSGISIVGSEINHSDTSSQSSSDNSGNTFIQDIVLDTFGHITSIVASVVDWTNVAFINETQTWTKLQTLTGTGTNLLINNTGDSGTVFEIWSNGTAGSVADLKINAPNPDIELIETDQSSPAGKYEIAVNGNDFQINSRNNADSSFETIFEFDQLRQSAGFARLFYSLNISKNLTATYIIGDGSFLTGLTENQITDLTHTGNNGITLVENNITDLAHVTNNGITLLENNITDLTHIGNNGITLVENNITDLTHIGNNGITLVENNITDLAHVTNNGITLVENNITDLTHTTDTNETTRVENIVGTSCTTGNFIFNFSQDGTPLCDAPSGSGDITAVTAGTGLIGGGLSGDVTLNISSETCGVGEVSKYNGTGFTCETDATGGGGGGNPFDQVLNTTSNVTFNRLNLTGSLESDLMPAADSTYDLGTAALRWLNVYFDNIIVGTITTTTLDASSITSSDWTNVTINENQINDLTHTTDTNASTICSGTTTYLDGEGNCDDISSVYEPAGITEADISDLQNYAVNNTSGWTLTFSDILSLDWTNVTIGKGSLLNSGALGFDWADGEVSDTLTLGSGSSIDKGALTNAGTLSFDWADSEIADTISVIGGILGANSVSGVWTTTGTLTLGDGGDRIDVSSNTWDVTNGVISGASIASTQLTDGGTIGFDWVDGEIADTLTIGSGSTVDKGALANTGTLSFDWADSEVADTLTIGASSSVNDGALSSNVALLNANQEFTGQNNYSNNATYTNNTRTFYGDEKQGEIYWDSINSRLVIKVS